MTNTIGTITARTDMRATLIASMIPIWAGATAGTSCIAVPLMVIRLSLSDSVSGPDTGEHPTMV